MTTSNRVEPGGIASLALPLLAACSDAAAKCWPWIGRGDKEGADGVAVAAMRAALSLVPGHGVVVVGEGEKDEAPMLFIGEAIGTGDGVAFELAVDPLEGTSLCARGAPGAVTVLAAAPAGTLGAPPGFYMDKLVVGAGAAGVADIDAPVEENVASIAAALGKPIGELRVAILSKPRHVELIERVRSAGASVVEIPDGDVMAGLCSLVPGWGIDVSLGIGGAPEGVISACAARLLGGDFQGRLVPQSDAERSHAESHGGLERRYDLDDLCPASDAVFAVSGVTGSPALPGVTISAEDKATVHSLLITEVGGLMHVVTTNDR